METRPKELATMGGGCFWCLEAAFRLVPGVIEVVSGYAGGEVENPTYEAVCSGSTGHAEVVQIEFDPAVIPYEKLLAYFWKLHDPTTLNRQGADVGTQYRSVIFYHDPGQQQLAQLSKEEASREWDRPIVTQIVPLKRFYPAEGYHQHYYERNPHQGYCQMVVRPKVEKIKKLVQ